MNWWPSRGACSFIFEPQINLLYSKTSGVATSHLYPKESVCILLKFDDRSKIQRAWRYAVAKWTPTFAIEEEIVWDLKQLDTLLALRSGV